MRGQLHVYELVRDSDPSGVSGTGPVAQAVEFASGRVAVSFYPGDTDVASVIVYDRMSDAEEIHGHNGATRFVHVADVGGHASPPPADPRLERTVEIG